MHFLSTLKSHLSLPELLVILVLASHSRRRTMMCNVKHGPDMIQYIIVCPIDKALISENITLLPLVPLYDGRKQ